MLARGYAEAYINLGAHLHGLEPGQHSSEKRHSGDNTVSDLIVHELNPRPPASIPIC